MLSLKVKKQGTKSIGHYFHNLELSPSKTKAVLEAKDYFESHNFICEFKWTHCKLQGNRVGRSKILIATQKKSGKTIASYIATSIPTTSEMGRIQQRLVNVESDYKLLIIAGTLINYKNGPFETISVALKGFDQRRISRYKRPFWS